MSRPPRIPSFSYTGCHRYFLTFCARQRHPVFTDEATAHKTRTQILRTSFEQGFAVPAYCLMPDHVHLLVEGVTAHADLRRFAKMAKQRSGADYALRGLGPLWQEGYYERVLRVDEDARKVARYILENPVRARLVTSPFEYPHLGSEVWPLEALFDVFG